MIKLNETGANRQFPLSLMHASQALDEKGWIYIGHEDDVPRCGDILACRIDGHELLFLRDMKGKLRAFFNRCPHRSARLCTTERGRVTHIVCPYHRWVFSLEGRLLSFLPEVEEPHAVDYVARFNQDGRLDLRHVPKLDHWRKHYFINFSHGAVGMRECLGGVDQQ